MMNVKEDDVNLGLGMGSTKFGIRTRLLSTSGAGVNADPTYDPLSELVWSPNNGLSLKRADSRAAEKKPFLVWNVGASSTEEGLSPLQSIRLKQSEDDAVVDQGNLSLSHTVLHADAMIIEKTTWPKASDSRHVETDGIAEAGQDIAERSNEESSAVIPATPLKKLESSAENDLCHLTEKDDCSSRGAELPRENDLPAEGSPLSSRICLHRETGKEKAFSDGDIHGRSSDDEDDSHGSAESSYSAGLSSKGIHCKKRQIYDKGVMLGSKRMKKQIHGSQGSPSLTRPDSSFVNWITNMTKVSPLTLACPSDVNTRNCHESESFMCFKPQESSNVSMGFQTIFQSLYCRETDVLNAGGKKIAEESRECAVDKSPENLPESRDRHCSKSSEHTIPCRKEVNPIVASKLSSNVDPFLYPSESDLAKNNASKELVSDRAKDGVMPPIPSGALGKELKIAAKETYPDIPMAMSDVLEESDPLTSFWITRLSSKTPRSEKGKEIAEESNRCSTPCTKADLDSRMNAVFPIEQKSSETRDESADHSKFNAPMKESRNLVMNSEASFEVKSISKLCPIVPSQRFGSEAMASVFARRVDALRHITWSRKGKHMTCSGVCFFCGGCHDVHECPNVTKPELEDLLLKLSAFDRVEEFSCLCIRCSRSDHWAISCPLAPCRWQRVSDTEQKDSLVSHLQPCDGEEGDDHKPVAADGSSRKPAYQSWKFEISSSKRVSDMQRTQSEIFHAIRKLRLSRADILRSMNSNVCSAHLTGFFLRLRLGKLEAGAGGSNYYVACITGDAPENDGCSSNKSILVDVGGIKSVVSSQYVSNHEFVEDEIKAWWWRTLDSGCRIPSLLELNSKLDHRKTLGF